MDANIKPLKDAYKKLREVCALEFRQSAMGGQDGESGQEFVLDMEMKLRSQMTEKYHSIKQEFIRFCEIKAKKYLEDSTAAMRKNIQTATYENLTQVQEEVREIKQEYISNPKAPKFPGYEILLAETLSDLVAKAGDYLSISQSQTSAISIKRLDERIKEMEKELKQARLEHIEDVKGLEHKNAQLEAEMT